MDQLKKRFQISRWIAEDFAGIISEEHRLSLNEWRQLSEENEAEYQELLKELREGKGKVEDRESITEREWKKFVQSQTGRRFIARRWLPYAAILLLLLGGVVTLHWMKSQTEHEVTEEGITIARGDIVLILSNGEKVALRDSVRIRKEENKANFQIEDKTICYSDDTTNAGRDAYNTLIVPRGGEYKIVLADGSRVWLNSETEFHYPVAFTGKCRRVVLKGEAYFEVAKDTLKPFVIRTLGEIDVKVLGTRFNLASYKEENEVVTTLAEGSVEVSSPDETVRICPNEQLVFNKTSHRFTRRQVDAGMYLAWKEGKFIFENQSLQQIMKQLQRWYQVEVVYADEAVKDSRFSGDLKKYDDFGKIIEMIKEVSGLQIRIENKCVIIGTR